VSRRRSAAPRAASGHNRPAAGSDYYGNSQIVDPPGKVVAVLGEKEGLVVHNVDLRAEVLNSRTDAFFGLNLLQDRRPEHYRPLVDAAYRMPPPPATQPVTATPSPGHDSPAGSID
jgi:hypothetical protein